MLKWLGFFPIGESNVATFIYSPFVLTSPELTQKAAFLHFFSPSIPYHTCLLVLPTFVAGAEWDP